MRGVGGLGVGRGEGGTLQVVVHFFKGAFGLREEVVDYALAELALVFVVVHFENLEDRGRGKSQHASLCK